MSTPTEALDSMNEVAPVDGYDEHDWCRYCGDRAEIGEWHRCPEPMVVRARYGVADATYIPEERERERHENVESIERW